MIGSAPIHAFAGYGIELEYMIVDRETLSVKPIADELLRQAAGADVSELRRGRLAWSNEFVPHLVWVSGGRANVHAPGLMAAFSLTGIKCQRVNLKLSKSGR